MLSILSETQQKIVDTITMRMNLVDALQYLKDTGYEMSKPTYYRHKRKIQDMKLERMRYIALHFQDQHVERIERCELVEALMWENYHLEDDPAKKVKILAEIINMQPFLSSYY